MEVEKEYMEVQEKTVLRELHCGSKVDPRGRPRNPSG